MDEAVDTPTTMRTAEEAADQAEMPAYRDHGVASQTGGGPFLFDSVTLQVFPLRANEYVLDRYVRNYLSVDDPEIVVFRAALPYVLFCVVDYGRMAPETQALGYWSQHEVVFSIPLERWRRVGDAMQFEGWGAVSPFIFVDEFQSLLTGREVFGWPKTAMQLIPELDSRLKSPFGPSGLLTMEVSTYTEVYADREQAPVTFLEVDQLREPSWSQVPPDPDGPLNPIATLSQAITGPVALWGGLVQAALRMWQSRTDSSEPWSLTNLRDLFSRLSGGLPGLEYDTINKKHFREATDPSRLCYEAITNTKLRIERFNNGGFLGDTHLLRGDMAGGYRLRVHRRPEFPVLESLGLILADDQAEGEEVVTLEPVLPYWLNLDLRYGSGERIAWRAGGPWLGGDQLE